MTDEKRILVACGSSVATATVLAGKIKKLMKKNDINFKIDQCKATEAASKSREFKADVIVSSCEIPGDTKDVPVIHGINFLTGQNVEETQNKILEALGE